MEYINFDAEVRPEDHGYQISVRSEIGETPDPIAAEFPFSDAQLESHLLKLENAILRSGERRRKERSPDERSVQEMGQALFDFLMVGEARSLYYECQRAAKRTGKGVRLRLHMGEVPWLAGLPWEFLYDPRRKDYLTFNPYTPVLRYLNLTSTASPLVVSPPLRILGMVASPSDLDELNVESEKRRVETALTSLQTKGLVELTWLNGQGWQELQAAMRDGPWHIFHFIGHGLFDQARDEGMVVFTNRQGRSHPISATQLNRLLLRQGGNLRLVVLNACEGAQAGQQDINSSVAATLAQGGIPAVLAMQYAITDDAAVVFAESFYTALADGLPIDSAVADARNAVNLQDKTSLEWGIPVLHMRSGDGRLFEAEVDNPPRPMPAQTRQTEPHLISALQQPADPISFDWITVPAGEFLMGSDRSKNIDAYDYETPQNQLSLPGFRIARVPVTNAQYQEFVQATGHQYPEHWKGEKIPDNKEKHPVVYASWDDAVAFCTWAQVRLPSEAEWEKAARGTDGRIYPWGNGEPNDKRCNFDLNEGDTTPVGIYTIGISPYGCLDMAGNVLEWTRSLYKDYPYNAEDGREDLTTSGVRVVRGGSFLDSRFSVRCTYRYWYGTVIQNNFIGFRVVSPGF